MDLVARISKHPFARIVGVYLIWKKLLLLISPRFYETRRDQLGRLVLAISATARKKFKEELDKQVQESQASSRKRWDQFGDALASLPLQGQSPESVLRLIKYFSSITNAPLPKHHFSGTIYSNSLGSDVDSTTELKSQSNPTTTPNLIPQDRVLATAEDLATLSRELKQLYQATFADAYLWNSLHINEFSIGDYMQYNVTRMVSSMFGGQDENVQGFVTSGGTESIMTACRLYRNWGYRSKGISRGQTVIIACDTVHAAVHKSGYAYDINIVLCRSTAQGDIDLNHMEALMKKYKHRVVALFGSAPSYPTGVIDPIAKLSALAIKYECGLHVDCCLGGFIVNNLDQYDTDFLKLPGVTTLSADTHKNGWAPKGSSALLMKPLRDRVYGNVSGSYWAMYSVPEWTGGIYATPRDPGSHQCVSSLHAFIALVTVGRQGYRQIAQLVFQACVEMADSVKQVAQLQLVVEPQVNVVCFRTNPDGPWPDTAIYALVHELNQRGFMLSAMKDGLVHFCVTGRFAGNPNIMSQWKQALIDSVQAVDSIAEQVKQGKMSFPGDAGIYGTIAEAMEPEVRTIGYAKFIQNWLLGNRGARDAVKGYFLGMMEPYSNF